MSRHDPLAIPSSTSSTTAALVSSSSSSSFHSTLVSPRQNQPSSVELGSSSSSSLSTSSCTSPISPRSLSPRSWTDSPGRPSSPEVSGGQFTDDEYRFSPAAILDYDATDVYDVIVVGAGLAGLSCARLLHRGGKRVLVLEAQDRVGGRTKAVTLGKSSYDVGGTWFSPTKQVEIARLADELGFESSQQYTTGRKQLEIDGQLSQYSGLLPPLGVFGLLELQMLINKVNGLADAVPAAEPWRAERATEYDAASAQQLHKTLYLDGAKALTDVLIRASFGVEPKDLCLLWFFAYVRAAGGIDVLSKTEGGLQEQRFKGLAWGICQRMAADLGPAVVQLSCPVRQINRHPDGNVVVVEGPQGRHWAAAARSAAR